MTDQRYDPPKNWWTKAIKAWERNYQRWLRKHPKPTPAPTPVPPKPTPGPKPIGYPEKGADFVSGPTPAQDKAAGIKFVMRYISTAGNPKNITKAELAALRHAGIQVGLVFETTGKTFLGGMAAGRADAKLAQAQVAALGYPTAVVYFACDIDPHGHEAAVVAYLRGAASILGHDRCGVYGGYAAVKAALDAKACKFAWQTYAWSYGKWDARARLRQVQNGVHVAGHGVDIDTALGAFGAL
jgi:hypothetical protein